MDMYDFLAWRESYTSHIGVATEIGSSRFGVGTGKRIQFSEYKQIKR